MDSFVAGVDIGGTGTKFGIVDNLGNIICNNLNVNSSVIALLHYI